MRPCCSTAKEVVDALDTVVRGEAIDRIIVAGDAGIVARLREQLPAALADKVVDELLVVAAPATLKPVQRLPDDAGAAPSLTESSSGDGAQQTQVHLADPLVTKATQTGAAVRIIEDPELLRAHGGVAAALRFRI